MILILYFIRMFWSVLYGYIFPPKATFPSPHDDGAVSFDVPMRCTLWDLDLFFHMNNANYLRNAELARWSLVAVTNSFLPALQGKLLFLAVENNVSYYKPIGPFVPYIIKVSIRTEDDKWQYFTQTFVQDPSTVKKGKEPIVYAKVVTKLVLKEKTGKTIKVTDAAEFSEFYKKLVETEAKLTENKKSE